MTTSSIEKIISRQFSIAKGKAQALPLPKFQGYTIGNLRGGIGKTSLAFNLSFLTDDCLVIDTCPQGNLSYFFDNAYFQNTATSAYDMLLPYFVPGLGQASRVARKIGATNIHFNKKSSFYVPSASELYTLPSQMANALMQARGSGTRQAQLIDRMLLALKSEVARELIDANAKRFLIDTSPFFAGATHLAWHAADALIVPVRTDQQSINSLELLLTTLSNPASEFLKTQTSQNHSPKIQLVVLTHCGWSTVKDSENVPNQQTKVFLEKVMDTVSRNISHFTTNDPANHIVILDDFLGAGRMSTAISKPIDLLTAGESMTISRVKTSVNNSVAKIKFQLKFISNCIW
jgi:chromosome partitioning protein